MLLAEMSWDEVEAYLEKDDRVVLPLGSTEQHGRRGPLGTDHIIPTGLSEALAEATSTVAAPPLVYGVSEHHMAYPGTVTIRPRTYMGFVEDVLESLHRHGFRRVFILNGHGGNVAPLRSLFLDVCNRHLDLKVREYEWWNLPGVVDLEKELFGSESICHASPGEISLAASVRPSVHKEKSVPPGIAHPWEHTFMNRNQQRELFPDGVLGSGNQNLSDPAKGRIMFERILELLKERFDEFE
ncbi:MAG: creatininase family protein [Planctomycetota bacterium]|jgi:creatinine amidohydrolase